MTGHQRFNPRGCLRSLPTLDVKANLILTSPPYDNLRDYGGHGFGFDRMADACVDALAEGGLSCGWWPMLRLMVRRLALLFGKPWGLWSAG